MNKFAVVTFSICMGLFLSFGAISEAEAKRFGGGKSFGNKMFQNKPAKRTSTAQPNKAQQQNTAQKQSLAKKGGMMGMLGGLMIGGMLGALFFGGAFENINFMDILIFGGIAFLLFKLLTSRNRAQPQTANGAPVQDYGRNDDAEPEHLQTRLAADQHSNSTKSSDIGRDNNTDANFDEEPENILNTGKIPRGFDQKSFLTGAENVFTLLQNAWDNGELGDLRQFCADEVFAEIQDQIRARESGSTTEILLLKSELVNVVKSDNSTDATVVFNAELKENNEFVQVQEVWYFVRPNNRQENTWLLEGIQQLED